MSNAELANALLLACQQRGIMNTRMYSSCAWVAIASPVATRLPAKPEMKKAKRLVKNFRTSLFLS